MSLTLVDSTDRVTDYHCSNTSGFGRYHNRENAHEGFYIDADRRKRRHDRVVLDDYIAEGHPGEVIDVFVDELDLACAAFERLRPQNKML